LHGTTIQRKLRLQLAAQLAEHQISRRKLRQLAARLISLLLAVRPISLRKLLQLAEARAEPATNKLFRLFKNVPDISVGNILRK
jgi:hypothetical protein